MQRAVIFVVAVMVGMPAFGADGVVSAPGGVVVSVSRPASEVGAAILARGGNAIDAAVATGFALAVTYPAAGNIGGGGFMVVRLPDGSATTFDFRETAPAAATPTMFLNDASEIDHARIKAGSLAVGVPGTVRGLALAHTKLGHLPWRETVEPSVTLARQGFVIRKTLAVALNRELAGPMKAFPGSVAAFAKPDGTPWQAGDRFRQPALADTLEAIAADGPNAFYTGWIADRVAREMADLGGLITRADLAAYEARERPPVRGVFLGHEILSMGSPSSGGVVLVEMLGMFESLRLQRLPRGSAEAIHLTTEIRRRAYLDRARYLGDPDFVAMPIERVLSRTHAEALAATIDPHRATSSVTLGIDVMNLAEESTETTHFSVVDRNGLAVSTTVTLEGSFGSHLVIPGTGFLLNNEMGDFNRKPGTTTESGDIGTAANIVAPGKRMLSSMAPTIVSRDGHLVLVTGSPGGRTIPNTVFDVVTGVVAHGLSGRAAVDARRSHHQWLPDRLVVEADGIDATTRAALESLGHEITEAAVQGSAHSVWIDPATGEPVGIPDRRGPDAAAVPAAHE